MGSEHAPDVVGRQQADRGDEQHQREHEVRAVDGEPERAECEPRERCARDAERELADPDPASQHPEEEARNTTNGLLLVSDTRLGIRPPVAKSVSKNRFGASVRVIISPVPAV